LATLHSLCAALDKGDDHKNAEERLRYEMVMRYAHLAADHLRTAACRIDGTFLSQSAKVHHLRAA
jgi:hypothetical protein